MLLTMHVPELGNLSFRFQIKPVLYAFKYIHLQAMNQKLVDWKINSINNVAFVTKVRDLLTDKSHLHTATAFCVLHDFLLTTPFSYRLEF